MVEDRCAIVGGARDAEDVAQVHLSELAVSEVRTIDDVGEPARRAPASLLACGLGLLYLALAAGAGDAFALRAHTILGIVLGGSLIALSVIDLRTFRLPDALTLPLAVAGIASAWWLGDEPVWRSVSAIAGYLALLAMIEAYRWWRGVDGMGLGDAKLMAAAGAWLGAQELPMTVLVACCSALLLTAATALVGDPTARHALWSRRLAFGPHIALGIWIVWLYGPLL